MGDIMFLQQMQTVSVCSYYERQTAEWQNNNNKRSVFKAHTVSLGWCGTWQSPCQSALLGDGEKRVGGALRMGPYMGRLVYLKRGRKTPADRLSEAER